MMQSWLILGRGKYIILGVLSGPLQAPPLLA